MKKTIIITCLALIISGFTVSHAMIQVSKSKIEYADDDPPTKKEEAVQADYKEKSDTTRTSGCAHKNTPCKKPCSCSSACKHKAKEEK